jgi:hypothetical protein
MPVRERDCTECGRTFRGDTLRCQTCRATEHQCEACSRTIRGNNNRLCTACQTTERECTECGRTFRGHEKRCQRCGRTADRSCIECGTAFRGTLRKCPACRATERQCTTCGQTFTVWSGQTKCTACQISDRQCSECGRAFRGTHARCLACRNPAGWLAQARKDRNARRARKLAAQITGPVPALVYAAVLASGPCVYCGDPATTVDHVCPLARGGYEAEYNLVPACGPCNSSKHDRLLTEWRPERVAHAVACSPVVAAEYIRQLGEALAAELVGCTP